MLLQLVLSCTLDSDLTVPLCASLFTLLGLVGKVGHMVMVDQLLAMPPQAVYVLHVGSVMFLLCILLYRMCTKVL